MEGEGSFNHGGLQEESSRPQEERFNLGGPEEESEERSNLGGPNGESCNLGRPQELQTDVSLMDDSNESFSDYMVYKYKIKPCSIPYRHDFKECHYRHFGDKFGRRDPREYPYRPFECKRFKEYGYCGVECEFAHGVAEIGFHPRFYRTKICKFGKDCRFETCFHAHKDEDLRKYQPKSSGSDSQYRGFMQPNFDEVVAGPPYGPRRKGNVGSAESRFEPHVSELWVEAKGGEDSNQPDFSWVEDLLEDEEATRPNSSKGGAGMP